MLEKLDIYDLLTVLIPGTLFIGGSCLLFPNLVDSFASTGGKLPASFQFLVLTSASILTGHLLQSLSSLTENLLYWTWGGRPSEQALKSGLGDRYLPADAAAKVRKTFQTAYGTDTTMRSLFLFGLACAENAGNPRVSKFNGLYGYFRSLLTFVIMMSILGVLAICAGQVNLGLGQFATIAVLDIALLWLLWLRTKQRAYYYVREVLFTAERSISNQNTESTCLHNQGNNNG